MVLALPTGARASVSVTFNFPSDVGVSASSYAASGTATLVLGFSPEPGTELTVVENTGLSFISGTFSNLAHGQTVALSYGGVMYEFVANYYGGTGNDLVLVWKANLALAWGNNSFAQLGNSSSANSSVPVAATASGVLSGKTIVAVAPGESHSLALCSDGTVAAWGQNYDGQLGNNSTTSSNVPVAVSTSGVLSAKTVVAIAAGALHSVAVCSDGTVAAWGSNTDGQLGDNSTTNSSVPLDLSSSALVVGTPLTKLSLGSTATHSLAIVGYTPVPTAPTVTTNPASFVTSTSATLNAAVKSGGLSTSVTFEYGLTPSFGSTAAAAQLPVIGTSDTTAVSAAISGLTPGTTYHFRVVGVNSLGSIHGAPITFTTLSIPAQQAWRQQYFGTTSNSGNAADTFDFDGDGIPNLLEWALNLNPITRSTRPIAAALNSPSFEFTYTRSVAAVNAGAVFTVEWSDTLAPGSWSSVGVPAGTVLTDNGTEQVVKVLLPAGSSGRRYVRLCVTVQ